MRHLLGISAYYHDAAAALLRDGNIVAAAQEERFSRRKNDERFPITPFSFACGRETSPVRISMRLFSMTSPSSSSPLLETCLSVAPRGGRLFLDALPSWLGEKLNLRHTIRQELPELREDCPILFTLHHEAHAASAFYPSPFREAAILTVDGVGEYATTTIGRGHDHQIELLQEIRFPHSLGLLYSAFTAYCGFRVNSGEYKLMGLAPYGEPRYVQTIYDQLLDLKPDGSFWLNLDYFDFLTRWRMTHDRFHQLFGGPSTPTRGTHRCPPHGRRPVHPGRDRGNHAAPRAAHAAPDPASRSLPCWRRRSQLRRQWKTPCQQLFDRIWIQPAAGDAGGALGAALTVFHRSNPASIRALSRRRTRCRLRCWARSFPPTRSWPCSAAIRPCLRNWKRTPCSTRTAELLAQQQIVAWFQGRMEFGPRALGNRSILADPRSPTVQSELN
jgi:carbamoyltransferase